MGGGGGIGSRGETSSSGGRFEGKRGWPERRSSGSSQAMGRQAVGARVELRCKKTRLHARLAENYGNSSESGCRQGKSSHLGFSADYCTSFAVACSCAGRQNRRVHYASVCSHPRLDAHVNPLPHRLSVTLRVRVASITSSSFWGSREPTWFKCLSDSSGGADGGVSVRYLR